jgi:hypothetical protein
MQLKLQHRQIEAGRLASRRSLSVLFIGLAEAAMIAIKSNQSQFKPKTPWRSGFGSRKSCGTAWQYQDYRDTGLALQAGGG